MRKIKTTKLHEDTKLSDKLCTVCALLKTYPSLNMEGVIGNYFDDKSSECIILASVYRWAMVILPTDMVTLCVSDLIILILLISRWVRSLQGNCTSN